MKLVVFIPAYNEEKTIADVISSIPRLKDFKSQQVIVINDGSVDRTAELARKAGAVVYSNQINRGLGFTFQSGIEKALAHGADIMVTLDADGQFPVNRIKDILDPILLNKADMVTGTRFLHKADHPENIGWTRYWGNKKVAWIMSKIVGEKFSDVSCGFRAYSKEALLKVNLYGRFTYTQEVLIDLAMKNIRIVEVPVKVKYFKKRHSRIFKNGLNYAFKSLWIIFRTYRDFAPLRVFGLIGIIFFLIGLAFDIVLLQHYLIYRVFTPYQFAGFIGGFFNLLGLSFLVVGLVTDMLVRIRMNQENILYQIKKVGSKTSKDLVDTIKID
jgi:glycosyltransferase involved in cell wall biosynthesis